MADQTVAPGQTVELKDGRIALVRFFGTTNFADGNWVGVELEDASGKNDGSVKGVRYFSCDENRGMFLRITGISRVVDEPARAPEHVVLDDGDVEEGDVDDEVLDEEANVEDIDVKPGGGAEARRPTRPGSIVTAGMGKRLSINGSSLSPASKSAARSGIRVRLCGGWGRCGGNNGPTKVASSLTCLSAVVYLLR